VTSAEFRHTVQYHPIQKVFQVRLEKAVLIRWLQYGS
jgi:hypothetical protein